MRGKHTIKTVFIVKPTLTSDKILAEFENDEIISEDEYEHSALFGTGHKRAKDFVKEHGGVIIRIVVCITESVSSYDMSNGIYLDID